MKWPLILLCIALAIDFAMDDPLNLRHPNFYALQQDVQVFASHLVHGEYTQLLPQSKR